MKVFFAYVLNYFVLVRKTLYTSHKLTYNDQRLQMIVLAWKSSSLVAFWTKLENGFKVLQLRLFQITFKDN